MEDVQLLLNSASTLAATATAAAMIGLTKIAGLAAVASTATAAVVGGKDALQYVNHFIGTNDGSEWIHGQRWA
jgi:hypothetical protein